MFARVTCWPMDPPPSSAVCLTRLPPVFLRLHTATLSIVCAVCGVRAAVVTEFSPHPRAERTVHTPPPSGKRSSARARLS